VAAVAPPSFALSPGPGLDASWHAGLHLAFSQGIAFGEELAFTFGPLGFLSFAGLYSGPTGALAFAYTCTVHVACVASLVFALRRSYPLPMAAGAAYVLTRLASWVSPPELILLPVFVVAVASVTGGLRPRALRVLPYALGLVAGLNLLSKVNTGVVVAGLSVVALAAPVTTAALRLLKFGVTAGAAAVAGWAATGQPLAALGSYAVQSSRIASGYSVAMVLDNPARTLDLWLALVAIAAVTALAAGAVIAGPRSERRVRRAALLVVSAWFVFALFKHGFVRQYLHTDFFFVLIAAAGAAYPLRGRLRAAGGACLLLLVLIALKGSAFVETSFLDSRASISSFREQAMILVVPSRRASVERTAREQLQAHYGLSPSTLSVIRAGRGHVDPWETTVVWAYDLGWRPLPVFQAYSAYTRGLDELNAASVRAERPDWILRERVRSSIDNRNISFESPAAVLATVCHYREVVSDRGWQVLEPAGNRCGPPRTLAALDAGDGDVVDVPRARNGGIVLARMVFRETLATRVRTVVYRGPYTSITLDGESYRLVADTASAGLLMRAPSDLFPGDGFGLEPSVRRFSFDRSPGGVTARVEFVEIPIDQ
jgi:hypothetical protein